MPWQSDGTFKRVNPDFSGADVWDQDRQVPIKIVASRHDYHDQDLATGIAQSLNIDGLNDMRAALKMGGYKITNIADATNNIDAPSYGQTAGSIAFAGTTLTLKQRNGTTVGTATIPNLSGTNTGDQVIIDWTVDQSPKVIDPANYVSGGDTLDLYKLNGSRALTGNMDAGNKQLANISGLSIGKSTAPTEALDVAGNAVVSGTLSAGSMLMPQASTGTARMELGTGRSGNGTAYIDLIGDAMYTDFGARFFRGGGPNTSTLIQHRGTGFLDIEAIDNGLVRVKTNAIERLRIGSDGTINFSNVQTGSSGLSTGDVFKDSNGGLRIEDGSPAGMKWEKSITIEEPSTSENISWFYADTDITIAKIALAVTGSASPSLTAQIRYSSGRSSAGTSLSDLTINSLSGTYSNYAKTIPANSWVWISTSAKSGTVDSAHITLVGAG